MSIKIAVVVLDMITSDGGTIVASKAFPNGECTGPDVDQFVSQQVSSFDHYVGLGEILNYEIKCHNFVFNLGKGV